MHWLRLPFIILGTLVAVGAAGTTVTIGYTIATAAPCTQIDSYYNTRPCRNSVAGIPLSWVHDASDNIVTTVVGTILTSVIVLVILSAIVYSLVMWIRSLKHPKAK